MAVVPKKLSFQLRFRNKTKTRKILNRDFRLQGLLKKELNYSSRFCNFFVKKEEQNNLLQNPLIALKAGDHKVNPYIRIITKLRADFNKGLKNNFLTRQNKYLHIYKKKSFFRPSWFLTNRIKIGNNYHINLKKIEDSNVQLTGGRINYNTLKSQKLLNKNWLSNKNNFLNSVLRSNYIFLKKKEAGRPRAGKLLFGRYGICFKQYSIISSKCVETAKLDIAKSLRKKGRFWIRICCDTPVTARPAETRMGKGKGSTSYWAARVNPGQLFFEFSGVSLVQLKEIYQRLCKKSAVSLKIVY